MDRLPTAYDGAAARTLTAIAGSCANLVPAVWKRQVEPGDCVVVTTRNSVYYLQALGGGLFDVSGGWFARSARRQPVAVSGCTFGGRAICTELVAARGLFLEFDNRVSTTRIQDVRMLRPDATAGAG